MAGTISESSISITAYRLKLPSLAEHSAMTAPIISSAISGNFCYNNYLIFSVIFCVAGCLKHPLIKDADLKVLQELGMGASGTVYIKMHRPMCNVIVKNINYQVDGQETFKNEIATELKILGGCQSPHIISFYSACVNHNNLCFCINFIEVGSLEQVSKIHGLLGEQVHKKDTGHTERTELLTLITK